MKSGGDAQKMGPPDKWTFFLSILLFKENKIMAFITLWTYLEIGTEHFFQLLSDSFVVGYFLPFNKTPLHFISKPFRFF